MLSNRNGKEQTDAFFDNMERIKKARRKIIFCLSILLAGSLAFSSCDLDAMIGFSDDSGQSVSGSLPSSEEGMSGSSSASSSSRDVTSASGGSSSEITAVPTVVPTIEIDSRYMYINVSVANFRSTPGTDSSGTVIKQLHYRTRVMRIAIEGSWSKVVTDDEESGYVYSEFLSLSLPPVTPTPAPARTLTKWPGLSSLGRSYYSANLSDYVGRDKDYQPLKGITVILDPGHGGADTGATYNSSVLEKTINLKVAQETEKLLTALGAEVIYTRSSDKSLGLYYRNAFVSKIILEKHKAVLVKNGEDTKETDRLIGLMNQVMALNSDVISSGGRGIFLGLGMSADIRTIMDITSEYDDILLLSIHCNSIANSPSTCGVEIYFGTNNSIYQDEKRLLADESPSNPLNPEYQFYDDSARTRFATALRDAVRKETKLDMRGVGDGLYVWNFCMIRENNLTSALIELGYLSNLSDRNFLTDPFNQKLMALGISNAVYNYFCAG